MTSGLVQQLSELAPQFVSPSPGVRQLGGGPSLLLLDDEEAVEVAVEVEVEVEVEVAVEVAVAVEVEVEVDTLPDPEPLPDPASERVTAVASNAPSLRALDASAEPPRASALESALPPASVSRCVAASFSLASGSSGRSGPPSSVPQHESANGSAARATLAGRRLTSSPA